MREILTDIELSSPADLHGPPGSRARRRTERHNVADVYLPRQFSLLT